MTTVRLIDTFMLYFERLKGDNDEYASIIKETTKAADIIPANTVIMQSINTLKRKRFIKGVFPNYFYNWNFYENYMRNLINYDHYQYMWWKVFYFNACNMFNKSWLWTDCSSLIFKHYTIPRCTNMEQLNSKLNMK